LRVLVEVGYAVAAEDVVDERLLLGRQELADGIAVDAPLVGARVLGGEQEVEPVGPAVGLLLDPREVDLQLVGGMAHRTQAAEPTGVGDGRHHVPAMAEGQDRELHAQHVADSGLHRFSSSPPTSVPRLRPDSQAAGRCERFAYRRLAAFLAVALLAPAFFEAAFLVAGPLLAA